MRGLLGVAGGGVRGLLCVAGSGVGGVGGGGAMVSWLGGGWPAGRQRTEGVESGRRA